MPYVCYIHKEQVAKKKKFTLTLYTSWELTKILQMIIFLAMQRVVQP